MENLTVETWPGVCPVQEDTRRLASLALQLGKQVVLDMGCGTGYIGIFLARHGISVDATDLSEEAVANAKYNAEKNGVTLNVFSSNLFQNISRKYDLIVFNPPRIPVASGTTSRIGSWVRKHPALVYLTLPLVKLVYGSKRFDFLLNFISEAQNFLNPEGALLLEITSQEMHALKKKNPNLAIKSLGQAEDISDTIIVMIKFL
ncbi:MAG: hypothetical protein A3G32_00135 [Deltaproteobacteria bacterium RIFCSPLOWO2_12_FULL_40_28]|nr:MAG: hypothetical protein A3C45_04625 [Deltaproteobacteria bacterium RIFCSPHIGHO2_02_FULL_40_28]OGQ20559.1 MAG: hypothetical protein A3E27_00900 [Deltaproteobacteria bacterium RIFCSPHIGHO2_12_FULL_40_32]OGQ41229.1 MAG: hypothetical protein A3I69_05715 [Deltaproteobacteria bacterium RIFCSPLOWO2_02_FULL_40_36]OGQ55204.1 MAG: hypothetical protein A3G32_00135 [Deltaproteobacteria bacterium RIFCSPLOWO2_12_FULL_40_28]